jgi:hypothetical protein
MHAINAVYESSYGMGSDPKIRSAPRTASKWSGPDRGGYKASTIWTILFWHHFPKVEDDNLIYLYRWRIREQNENPKNRERGWGTGNASSIGWRIGRWNKNGEVGASDTRGGGGISESLCEPYAVRVARTVTGGG